MPNIPRLSTENITFIFIDLQERLLKAIPVSEKLLRRNRFLLESSKILGVPHLATTQYKKGLGDIVSSFLSGLTTAALDKSTFSCGIDSVISETLKGFERECLIVSGVETHICVLQTVLDFIQSGYQVAVVVDAVAARSEIDHKLGLRRMAQAGALMVTSEMVIYELLRGSDSENFKKMLPLIKELGS